MAWERDPGEPEVLDTLSYRSTRASRKWALGDHPETDSCCVDVACAHCEPLREKHVDSLSSVTGSRLLGVGSGRVLPFAFGGCCVSQEGEVSPVGPVESHVT